MRLGPVGSGWVRLVLVGSNWVQLHLVGPGLDLLGLVGIPHCYIHRGEHFLPHSFIYDVPGKDVWGLPSVEYPGLVKVRLSIIFVFVFL